MSTTDYINDIFNIKSEKEFNALALQAFSYQAQHNDVYKQYIKLLDVNIDHIKSIFEIPFLPVSFFKTHTVVCNDLNVSSLQKTIFTSSGTTGINTSKHHVADVSIYERSYSQGFDLFYGNVKDYCLLALLPSYLERDGSSLVYMINDLIEKTEHPSSGFYLNNLPELISVLKELESKNQKTILLGVTYALIDLAELFQNEPSFSLKNTIIMETGGMKGKRREMVKEELHTHLCNCFGVKEIHSEYGMTELLSQAYSKKQGIFYSPPWMRVLIRDTSDPFSYITKFKTGGINIIDLANIHSCCFIATQDLGKLHSDNSFEIIGRFDNSDIRGCNLLIQG